MIRVLEGWNRVGPGMGLGRTWNLDSALSQLYETVAAILTNAKMYLNCTSKIKLLFLRKFCDFCENCEKRSFESESKLSILIIHLNDI